MGVVFRQSFKGMVSTFAGAFIGFLTTFFVVAKFLSPNEIGLTRVLYEVGMLLAGFAMLGTQSSAIRYYPYLKTEDGKNRGFFRYLILIPLLGGGIIAALYLLLGDTVTTYFGNKSTIFKEYSLWVLPMMFFLIYQTLLETYASIYQRVAVPKVIREVLLRVLLLGVYIAYGVGGISFSWMVGAFVGTYGVIAAVNFLYCIWLDPIGTRAKLQPVEREVGRSFLSYTVWIVLAALSGNLVGRLDIFMISAQMGLDYSGIYTIAFFIVAIIDIPSRSHIAMLSPQVSGYIQKREYSRAEELFKKIAHYQLLIGGVLFVAIWVNIDTIFMLIPNTNTYMQGKWVVFFLGLSRVVDVSFSFGNTILRYSPYYRWIIILTLIVTLFSILLNYICIEWWGINGAALATLGTLVVNYSVSQLILARSMNVSPMDLDMIKGWGILALAIIANEVTPNVSGPIINSIVKTTAILLPTIWLFSTMRGYKPLLNEINLLWRRKKNS